MATDFARELLDQDFIAGRIKEGFLIFDNRSMSIGIDIFTRGMAELTAEPLRNNFSASMLNRFNKFPISHCLFKQLFVVNESFRFCDRQKG